MQGVGFSTGLLYFVLKLLPLILRAIVLKGGRNLAVDYSMGIGTSGNSHRTAHCTYISPLLGHDDYQCL